MRCRSFSGETCSASDDVFRSRREALHAAIPLFGLGGRLGIVRIESASILRRVDEPLREERQLPISPGNRGLHAPALRGSTGRHGAPRHVSRETPRVKKTRGGRAPFPSGGRSQTCRIAVRRRAHPPGSACNRLPSPATAATDHLCPLDRCSRTRARDVGKTMTVILRRSDPPDATRRHRRTCRCSGASVIRLECA